MTKTQYDYMWITDAGHGWLRVDRSEYELTGFQGSGYSYADENSVYLEEDCDAPQYLALHKGSLSPRSFPVHHYNGMSPIRDMARITAIQGKQECLDLNRTLTMPTPKSQLKFSIKPQIKVSEGAWIC